MTATPHPEAMDETHNAGFSTTQAEDLVKLANSFHARSLTWAIGISVTAVVTAFILILIVTLSLNSRFNTGLTTVRRHSRCRLLRTQIVHFVGSRRARHLY